MFIIPINLQFEIPFLLYLSKFKVPLICQTNRYYNFEERAIIDDNALTESLEFPKI